MQINPQEPCSTAFDYFTAEEKRHLEAFLNLGIDADQIYTNAAGETRTVRRIFYPYGLQTALTVYGQHVQKGSPYRFYHTPLASISAHREGEVIYTTPDGKSYNVRSGAFLAWLGSEFTMQPVKDTNVPTVVPVKQIKSLEDGQTNLAALDKARAEDKEEKADWTPMKKRKESSKKF